VVENSRRVRHARSIASAAIGLAVVWAAPRDSWWLVPMFALSVLNTATVDVRMRRARRPEYQAAFAVFLSQALIALASAVSGGPRSPMLSLMAVPTAFVATRFRPAVCVAAAATAIALILVVSFGLSPARTVSDPTGVLVAVVTVVGISAATHALFDAELHHRREAILDPLTGVLNRYGLEQRFHELAEQARLTGAPISLLICDLDHFKQVNDAHGHAAGDAVLRDAALALRRQLRSFELIYRLGGEEFAIVLPGATAPDAEALGGRLCEAIRTCRTHEPRITASIGVATQWGADLQFKVLYEAADRALYEAKAAGRDQVATAPTPATTDPRAAAHEAQL
jgi:diguanylate cyclase (GGDEF)-like protein